MPRTASVLAMSLTDLERTIRDRRRALSKLERKRARWQKKLNAVERKITALAGSARGGRRGRLGSRPRNAMSLSEAIEQVLSRASTPMNVRTIAQKVQAGGYRSGSANFRGIVNQMLIKEKRFESAGRGLYQLNGRAAGASPRKAKRRTPAKK